MKIDIKFMNGGFRTSRKGITPVIAIVLLLMMTVAAAGMAYIWIQSVQEDVENQANSNMAEQQKQASAAIKIESVYNGTGNELIYVLRNSGTYTYDENDLAGFQYYINGKPVTPSVKCSAASLNAPKTICTVNATAQFPYGAGSKVLISVVPGFGRGAEYACAVDAVGAETC